MGPHRNNGARTYGGVGSGLYRSTRRRRHVDADREHHRRPADVRHGADGAHREHDARPHRRRGRAERPDRVYVVYGNQTGADKGFLVSNDGGDSFTAGGRAGGNSGFEWWFGRLLVDPVNKDSLFNVDVNLRLSTNGGTTWATSGGRHADQHGMAWDPNVANRVYLGNDGGIYRSEGNGSNGTWVHATYEPFNQGYHLAVAADDPNRIAIGLQDNGSNRTWTNGSSTADAAIHLQQLRRRRRPLRRDRPDEPQLLLPVLAGRRVRRAARHRDHERQPRLLGEARRPLDDRRTARARPEQPGDRLHRRRGHRPLHEPLPGRLHADQPRRSERPARPDPAGGAGHRALREPLRRGHGDRPREGRAAGLDAAEQLRPDDLRRHRHRPALEDERRGRARGRSSRRQTSCPRGG